jgi:hypothetical protein
MKSMPKEIKQKLRQLQKARQKVDNLSCEIEEMLEEYGINTDYLRVTGDEYKVEMETEALAFIDYNEGNIEDNIKEIEKVFLYYVNKNEGDKS